MMWGYVPNMGMMGSGYGCGFGLLHMAIWLAILAAIVAGVVWLLRTLAQPGAHQFSTRRSPGLQVLEERYARGEINRDEYLQRSKTFPTDLSRSEWRQTLVVCCAKGRCQ